MQPSTPSIPPRDRLTTPAPRATTPELAAYVAASERLATALREQAAALAALRAAEAVTVATRAGERAKGLREVLSGRRDTLVPWSGAAPCANAGLARTADPALTALGLGRRPRAVGAAR